MSLTLLSTVMDFAVMAALIGTIYFALRLSKSLNNFRAHRNEMKALIAELSKNINDAQGAIEGLKATSNIAANNLDDVLHDSRRMAEELKLINETGENLANRLENLAAASASSYERSSDIEDEEYYEELEAANTDDGPPQPPSFFIQDRDFEEEDAQDGNDDFISEAEKELLQALKQNKKTG